jgi:hypothetical protein
LVCCFALLIAAQLARKRWEKVLYRRLEMIAGMKGDDTTRSNLHFFAGLGISARARGLVSQLKGAETRNLDEVTTFERPRISSKKASTICLASRLLMPPCANRRSASSALVRVIRGLRFSW